MPETIKLADGSEREVLTADEQMALQDKATKVDEGGKHVEALKNLRTHTKELERQLREKGVTVKSVDGDAPTPDELRQQSVDAARQVVQESESKKLEKLRDKRLLELAGGDENKKKVIEEKFHRAVGDKIITDPEELEDYLTDAAYLANKNRDGSIMNNPVFKSASGGVGGAIAPIRGNSTTRTRGAEIATAMGYELKNPKIAE